MGLFRASCSLGEDKPRAHAWGILWRVGLMSNVPLDKVCRLIDMFSSPGLD